MPVNSPHTSQQSLGTQVHTFQQFLGTQEEWSYQVLVMKKITFLSLKRFHGEREI